MVRGFGLRLLRLRSRGRIAARMDCLVHPPRRASIAPEFDRILESRCRWVLEEGGRLLGPSPEAVALTADKLALAEHLERSGEVEYFDLIEEQNRNRA